MTVEVGDCVGFLNVVDIIPDGLEPDIIVCLCGCGVEERLHEADLDDWRISGPTCGHEPDEVDEADTCEACDDVEAPVCEGCGCCANCCNCTPTDCDCDVCEERRHDSEED